MTDIDIIDPAAEAIENVSVAWHIIADLTREARLPEDSPVATLLDRVRSLVAMEERLAAPVDVEAEVERVMNEILDQPGDSILTSHVRDPVRSLVTEKARLQREGETWVARAIGGTDTIARERREHAAEIARLKSGPSGEAAARLAKVGEDAVKVLWCEGHRNLAGCLREALAAAGELGHPSSLTEAPHVTHEATIEEAIGMIHGYPAWYEITQDQRDRTWAAFRWLVDNLLSRREIPPEVRPTESSSFERHLEAAEAEMRRWPEWKKDVAARLFVPPPAAHPRDHAPNAEPDSVDPRDLPPETPLPTYEEALETLEKLRLAFEYPNTRELWAELRAKVGAP
jgi:hypothetical protein